MLGRLKMYKKTQLKWDATTKVGTLSLLTLETMKKKFNHRNHKLCLTVALHLPLKNFCYFDKSFLRFWRQPRFFEFLGESRSSRMKRGKTM